jgi:hypothetical protein
MPCPDHPVSMAPAAMWFEEWTVVTHQPDCHHEFTCEFEGRFAKRIRRCWRCSAIATVRRKTSEESR